MSTASSSNSEPFDPERPGTAERLWTETLRTVPEWQPGARPLLVVSPHPDDEVLGAGGLMRRHAHAGHEVTVLSVTDGEAAYPDWQGLDQVRRRELDDALDVLAGGKVGTRHLGIPDGRVDANRSALFDAVRHLVAHNPILVGPYERDGHPDHDATGAVCCAIAHLHALTLVRYPIWAWHHRAPEHFADHHWGRLSLDPGTRIAKTHAIRCFTSQLKPRGGPPIVPSRVLPYFERSYEAFLL